MKSSLIACCLLMVINGLFAHDEYKCYPANWWIGMKNPNLQLMVHSQGIANATAFTINYPGVKLNKVNRVDNPNYVFIDLTILPSAKPGIFKLKVANKTSPFDISVELKKKKIAEDGKTRIKGVTSADFIYLVVPDRFSDGDPSNNRIPGMRDTALDRANSLLRHGGDIKGITNHLDYFKELGVTTLWLTPVVENDMPPEKEPSGLLSGYHGYWITDHYEIDKRFGGEEAYRELIGAAHSKGIKIIQDAVCNHVGEYHWFVIDPPMKDWLNNWPSYQGTNHREEVFIDPYASEADKKIMTDGWFVPHLPDLNLANPFLATYIIQNTIWATEEFGIDGWRVDTYKYNNEKFLININNALNAEFPSLTGFGEVTSNSVTASAYFTKNNIITPVKHNMQGVTDFPVSGAMLAGMNDAFGWTTGVNRIYSTLAQDILYKDPRRNCIFLDNHDMDRVFSVIGEDYEKLKMGLTWLLTLRGIPQLYYGTEILMKNFKNPSDGMVRLDFPGGWEGDKENKFTKDGRTGNEGEAFEYIKSLANYRKNSSALTTGETMQYIPLDGLYVYFRYDKKQTVMVASNTNDKEVDVHVGRFKERSNGVHKIKNVITGDIQEFTDFSIPAKSCAVYELLK